VFGCVFPLAPEQDVQTGEIQDFDWASVQRLVGTGPAGVAASSLSPKTLLE